jgi:tetratricopeptide (TPR) repeat protein
MRKVKADFRLDEQAVNAWAEELIDDNHVNEALALGSLNILMYPDSAAAYSSLGRVYAIAGQRALAIENYRIALEKDPDNEGARRALVDLSQ